LDYYYYYMYYYDYYVDVEIVLTLCSQHFGDSKIQNNKYKKNK